MPNINKVILAGHLGRDAETKTTPSGASVTNFSLATTERFKDKAGEFKEVTTWTNIVAWRLSDKFVPLLTKGSALLIEGKLSNRTYEGKDGTTKYVTEVISDSVQLLKAGGSSSGYEGETAAAAKAGKTLEDIPW